MKTFVTKYGYKVECCMINDINGNDTGRTELVVFKDDEIVKKFKATKRNYKLLKRVFKDLEELENGR